MPAGPGITVASVPQQGLPWGRAQVGMARITPGVSPGRAPSVRAPRARRPAWSSRQGASAVPCPPTARQGGGGVRRRHPGPAGHLEPEPRAACGAGQSLGKPGRLRPLGSCPGPASPRDEHDLPSACAESAGKASRLFQGARTLRWAGPGGEGGLGAPLPFPHSAGFAEHWPPGCSSGQRGHTGGWCQRESRHAGTLQTSCPMYEPHIFIEKIIKGSSRRFREWPPVPMGGVLGLQRVRALPWAPEGSRLGSPVWPEGSGQGH